RGHPGAHRLRARTRGRLRAVPGGGPRHGPSGHPSPVPTRCTNSAGCPDGQARGEAAGHPSAQVSGGRDALGRRRRASARAAVRCLLLCLVSVAVVGGSADRPAGRRGGDGMAVLRRAAETSVRLSYQGVRVVSWVDSTGRTETARLNILHQPGVGTLVSPLHDTGEGTNLLVGSTPWGRVGKDVLDVLETNFWV